MTRRRIRFVYLEISTFSFQSEEIMQKYIEYVSAIVRSNKPRWQAALNNYAITPLPQFYYKVDSYGFAQNC